MNYMDSYMIGYSNTWLTFTPCPRSFLIHIWDACSSILHKCQMQLNHSYGSRSLQSEATGANWKPIENNNTLKLYGILVDSLVCSLKFINNGEDKYHFLITEYRKTKGGMPLCALCDKNCYILLLHDLVKNHTPYGFLLCQVWSDFGVLEYWSSRVLNLL